MKTLKLFFSVIMVLLLTASATQLSAQNEWRQKVKDAEDAITNAVKKFEEKGPVGDEAAEELVEQIKEVEGFNIDRYERKMKEQFEKQLAENLADHAERLEKIAEEFEEAVDEVIKEKEEMEMKMEELSIDGGQLSLGAGNGNQPDGGNGKVDPLDPNAGEVGNPTAGGSSGNGKPDPLQEEKDEIMAQKEQYYERQAENIEDFRKKLAKLEGKLPR